VRKKINDNGKGNKEQAKGKTTQIYKHPYGEISGKSSIFREETCNIICFTGDLCGWRGKWHHQIFVRQSSPFEAIKD
jgi:hypothetical protein